MTRRYIKIFGLPRTCTNLAEVLLRENFRDVFLLTNFPCWKHGKSTIQGTSIHGVLHGERIDCDEVRFVVCLKNPYNWLRSFNNFEAPRRERPLTDLEFLASASSFHYKDLNPVDTWCEMNRHWLSMVDDRSAMQVIRHEDLLRSQAGFAERVQAAFHLERASEQFVEIRNQVRPYAKVAEQAYLPKPHGFSSAAIDYINARLDREFVEALGYDLLAP